MSRTWARKKKMVRTSYGMQEHGSLVSKEMSFNPPEKRPMQGNGAKE